MTVEKLFVHYHLFARIIIFSTINTAIAAMNVPDS